MAASQWIFRCLPGLSVILLLALVEWAFQIVETAAISIRHPADLIYRVNWAFPQFLFILYSTFLHFLAFIFPLRLCRSVWQATNQIKVTHNITPSDQLPIKEKNTCTLQDNDDPSGLRGGGAPNQILNAIMIPSYKEDISVLEDTLKILASHFLAISTYDIFLAMEARDPKATSTAECLIKAFRSQFRDIQYTIHPVGLPGEAPGKSSNISWAANEVKRKYNGSEHWKDVMLTVMDSDTHLLSEYFELVQSRHMYNRSHGNMTDMSLYMPPIVFDRNACQVPALVRVADLMWCGAGLSCFQKEPGRAGIAFPTAVYTVTLPLVHLVGGWDTGPEAIGEDMHMMLKCYFATNGKLSIETIPSPASQCNVTAAGAGIRGWFSHQQARYTQGLRHMWGCLDTGFAVRLWLQLGQRQSTRPQTRSRKLSHTELELKLSQLQQHGDRATKLTWRNAVLLTRIFEAHFLPSHLFIVMIASGIYTHLVPPLAQGRLLSMFLDFTAVLRAVSFVAMVMYFLLFYERYHAVCIEARKAGMRRAGLYEEMLDTFSPRFRRRPQTWLDYLAFPIAGTLFGSIPLIHAAFAHFHSDRLGYTVSGKPTRRIETAVDEEG